MDKKQQNPRKFDQLEYTTVGHIATYTIFKRFTMALFFKFLVV